MMWLVMEPTSSNSSSAVGPTAYLLVALLELLYQVWGVGNCHHQRLLVHLQKNYT
jgi:hypothetical protein